MLSAESWSAYDAGEEAIMRRMQWCAVLLVACGGATGNGNPGGGDLAMADMGMAAVTIPDPGTSHDVDNNFGDVEPNDAPSQATPLGVSMLADVHVWVNSDAIDGGGDNTDYFVFKSGSSAGQFTFDICWS